MVGKKFLATTVSSREKRMKRRGSNEELTSIRQKETTDKQKFQIVQQQGQRKILYHEERRMHERQRNSHRSSWQKKEKESAAATKWMRCMKGQSEGGKKRSKAAAAACTHFRTKRRRDKQQQLSLSCKKNTRSMSSIERLEELFSEIYRARWDVILISETWRQGKEIWETEQGHIVIETRKFTNKHGVAIILNKMRRNRINWVECACERVVAASISVDKQPITWVSAYLPHSGYPDHHVERTFKTISKIIDKGKAWRSLEEISTLSLVLELVLNYQMLFTTHSTKRIAEASGWHNGYMRRILSRWTQFTRRYRKNK